MGSTGDSSTSGSVVLEVGWGAFVVLLAVLLAALVDVAGAVLVSCVVSSFPHAERVRGSTNRRGSRRVFIAFLLLLVVGFVVGNC